MTRAATTLADPCTGAPRRDFLLGLHRGQLVRAQVPSWCSRHGWTLVAPNELARLASLQLVATRHPEGTGGTRDVGEPCPPRQSEQGSETGETDARDIEIATLEAELRAQRDLIARLDQN